MRNELVASQEGHRPTWRMPGLIDAHAHLAWTDFDDADRSRRTPEQTRLLIREQRRELLDCGFTAMRDAGGYEGDKAVLGVDAVNDGLVVMGCASMLTGDDLRDAPTSRRTYARIGRSPARWVKLMLTGGMNVDMERALQPTMSRERIFQAVGRIHAMGRKAMAHAWGGRALDWAIEAGIDSIEHGVLLTGEQAERMAAKHIPLVPTVAIYRILAEPEADLGIPLLVSARAARAAEAHPRAVRLAREAGVALGVGTDFCTPILFGRNLEELDALEDCGLTRGESLAAATLVNARITGLEAGQVAFDLDPMQVSHASDLRGHVA